MASLRTLIICLRVTLNFLQRFNVVCSNFGGEFPNLPPLPIFWKPLAAGPLLRAHFCESAALPSISSPALIQSPAADLMGPRRRVWGRWFGTAFHSLWCSKRGCFHLDHDCKCRLCGLGTALRREHLVHCKWVLADFVSFDAIELLKLEKALFATRPQ